MRCVFAIASLPHDKELLQVYVLGSNIFMFDRLMAKQSGSDLTFRVTLVHALSSHLQLFVQEF